MTRLIALAAAAGLVATLAASCSKQSDNSKDKGDGLGPALPPPAVDPEKGDFTLDEATAGLAGSGALMARISTEKGNLECELFPDKAPKTVASFVGLARGLRPWKDPKDGQWKKSPYFDGLAFHRVIPGFMIQGGDALSRDYSSNMIGTGDAGYSLPDEVVKDLIFDRPGRMAMANSGPGTNSGGSQFFVTEGPRKALNGGYTIFGQCDDAATAVVKEIARVPRDGNDKPTTPLLMRVEIFRR